eukprot:2316739-Rhodomonas_salina.3
MLQSCAFSVVGTHKDEHAVHSTRCPALTADHRRRNRGQRWWGSGTTQTRDSRPSLERTQASKYSRCSHQIVGPCDAILGTESGHAATRLTWITSATPP